MCINVVPIPPMAQSYEYHWTDMMEPWLSLPGIPYPFRSDGVGAEVPGRSTSALALGYG